MAQDNTRYTIAELRNALFDAATQCDKWAEESIIGGWSTHQVKANRDMADNLRRIASTPYP